MLAIFDVDEFKRINDTGGHETGDCVLKVIASGLKMSVRPDDVVSGIGGDEFAMLAPGLTLRQAESRLRSMLEKLEASLEEAANLPRVTLSCGAAEYSAGDTMQSLMSRADQALYEAKRKGKNRVAVKTLPLIRDLLSR